jgi:hypothetical protein
MFLVPATNLKNKKKFNLVAGTVYVVFWYSHKISLNSEHIKSYPKGQFIKKVSRDGSVLVSAG